jgi:transglutaminase-like putative cysteine protease
VPRRAIAYILDDAGVPETLGLADSLPTAPASTAWQARTTLTLERLDRQRVNYSRIEELRGVPAEHCATSQAQIELTFAGRTFILQPGATGPKGGPYFWESVQLDPLWADSVAQAFRCGGVIYNADTYLWADLYLVLFANGVADITAHFINTKLHIKGYDFQGLPLLRLAGDAIRPVQASLPRDGSRFANLNFTDAAILCSAEHPARLEPVGGDLHYYPLADIINPQLPETPSQKWEEGFARTVRFQVSLSDAPPVIARYVAPAWWYALSDEPWPGGWLPVSGACAPVAQTVCDLVRTEMYRGSFLGGSGAPPCAWGVKGQNAGGNDGDAGYGLFQNYYFTGRPEYLADALNFSYFWADLMVDHTDFSIRQWVGGWGWKTCAYSKFRDLIFAYLETGDPYLLDTAEMAAAAYWAWYRANWPRCAVGRDNFELGAWALLWRFFDDPHARERTHEFVRMNAVVLKSRGSIGGQIGCGPHPGYVSALFMTGVTMLALEEAGAAAVEKDDPGLLARVGELLPVLHAWFSRRDVEIFPSNQEYTLAATGLHGRRLWEGAALRIYSEWSRWVKPGDADAASGLRMVLEMLDSWPGTWPDGQRRTQFYVNPLYTDAMLLGARLDGAGVSLAPLQWMPAQTVHTPFGDLRIRFDNGIVQFDAAAEFPVTVNGLRTTSRGTITVPARRDLGPFTAKGFPFDWDQLLAATPVRGIDRHQAQSVVRVCAQTEDFVYGPDFSPRKIRYLRGSRPVLEEIAGSLHTATDVLQWVHDHLAHPHIAGGVPADRALTEEAIIESGRGWCNEQARVFVALCEVREIPARLCFLFHAYKQCGHVAAEAWDGAQWVFYDPTFNITVPGTEARELTQAGRKRAHLAYQPTLANYYAKMLPEFTNVPGWGTHDRPAVDAGGHLFDVIGICNYLTDGVTVS